MGGKWISRTFVARDAVQLDHLVLNTENPERDFYSPGQLSPDRIACVQLVSFLDSVSRCEGSRFHSFLTQLVSMSFGVQHELKTVVESAVYKTYKLKNSRDFFREMCQSQGAREWIERAIRRRKGVYIVVGIKTLTDAKVNLRKTRTTQTAIEIPVGQFVPTISVRNNSGIVIGGSRTIYADQTAECVVQ
jgi:hypothetical protein